MKQVVYTEIENPLKAQQSKWSITQLYKSDNMLQSSDTCICKVLETGPEVALS